MLRQSRPDVAGAARLKGSAGDVHTWTLASEVPVEIGFNGKPWAVMMASPADLEDLAIGLAWTEGALLDPAAISHVEVLSFPEGKAADISIPGDALDRDRIKARTIEGRLGCGLCGVEQLADTIKPVAAVSGDLPDTSAIGAAFENMRSEQPLFSRTRSVHAAALAGPDGSLVCVREDVGRHNALDKLVGACLRGEVDAGNCFLVMTSRCSYELVQKAARLGVSLLATISAPTLRAVALADEVGMALACKGEGQDILIVQKGGE